MILVWFRYVLSIPLGIDSKGPLDSPAATLSWATPARVLYPPSRQTASDSLFTQQLFDNKGACVCSALYTRWANSAVQSVNVLQKASQPTSNSSLIIPLSPGYILGAMDGHFRQPRTHSLPFAGALHGNYISRGCDKDFIHWNE
ncbi:hypothetical protein BJX99DRAFT_199619 [Aspergillus californicus]